VRRAALICYFVGAATDLLIGAFNPYGWCSVLLSAALPGAPKKSPLTRAGFMH
jgi:hypothetical protein